MNPVEQERLAEQAADRIVRRQIEDDDLEREKDKLLGQEAIFNQQIEATVKSGRVVGSGEVRALISTFLADCFPRAQFLHDGEEPCWTLKPDAALVAYLEQFMLAGSKQQRLNSRFLEALHAGSEIALTFDNELARRRPLLEFVTARHPLAAAAVDYWQRKALGGVPATSVRVEGVTGESGDGYFFIYQLSTGGVRPQYTLQPVIVLDDGRVAAETAETLLSQLQADRSAERLSFSADDFAAAQSRADRAMARQRDALKDETLRRNEALIAARMASVRTSFEAKINRAQTQSWAARDERIRRMRGAQVKNLQAQLAAKLTALEQAQHVSVSYTLIAGGRLRVSPAVVQTAPPPVRQSPAVAPQRPPALHAEVLTYVPPAPPVARPAPPPVAATDPPIVREVAQAPPHAAVATRREVVNEHVAEQVAAVIPPAVEETSLEETLGGKMSRWWNKLRGK